MSDRYFVETPITSGRVALAGPEAHHLIHVMRAKRGDRVVLFDGSGAEFDARLDRIGRNEAEFTILSTHLKAGTSGSDEADRLAMTTVIRNYLNDYPADSNFMVAGDFNIRTASESCYQMLTGFQADNDGRSKDPISAEGYWHDNSSYRFIHTQATQLEWGGMDDRFDFILVSFALDDGDGLSYSDGTYEAFGNDGAHLNLAAMVQKGAAELREPSQHERPR